MSDMTLKKQQAVAQTEAVLRESEQYIHAIWENASDAMAISAPDGTVFAANPAYFRLYGYLPEEIIGKDFSIIFPKEHRVVAQGMYNYIFQSPTISPSFETTIIRSDGTERCVESSYSFISQNGSRIAMISIVRDITERKKVEEELRISRLKLHLALEMSHLGSWDWHIVSDTIRWSANLEVSLGLVPASSTLRYAAFLEMVHPQDRVQIEQEIKHALEDGADIAADFRTVSSDGTIRRIKTQGEVLFDDDGKPIRMIGVCQIIT